MELHGPAEATELAGQVWPCYRDVFGDFDDFATWRGDMFDRHVGRDGYRLAVGMDSDTVAEVLAFGYTTHCSPASAESAC